jgi:hypothetical protein
MKNTLPFIVLIVGIFLAFYAFNYMLEQSIEEVRNIKCNK